MKKLIFFIFFGFIITGCMKDDVDVSSIDNTSSIADQYPELKKALKDAEALRVELFGRNESTRSGNSDLQIDPIRVGHTRASMETQYYIVNYGNGEGYAVLTAIPGMESVHAISDEGSIHISDTVANKGLAAFFGNLENQLSNISYTVFEPDTTQYDLQPTVRNETTIKRAPLINVSVKQWHQDYPYNQMCPDYFESPKKVGCMALSAAQILSYYEWPENVKYLEIDWKLLKQLNTFSIQLPALLAHIGSSDYLDLNYYVQVFNNDGNWEYGTFGQEEKVIPTFVKLGYKQLSKAKNFSESVAASDLSQYGPLLIYSTNYPYGGGHAWVMDGYIHKYREVWSKVSDSSNEYYWKPINSYMFHCIWGEKDHGNGYYRWNSDDKYLGGDYPDDGEIYDKKLPGAKMCGIHYYYDFTINN